MFMFLFKVKYERIETFQFAFKNFFKWCRKSDRFHVKNVIFSHHFFNNKPISIMYSLKKKVVLDFILVKIQQAEVTEDYSAKNP